MAAFNRTDHLAFTQMGGEGVPWVGLSPFTNDPHVFDTFYGGYKTVEEIQTFLDQEVATSPNLAEKVDIGDSWCKSHPGFCTQPAPNNGYDLWVLHITNRGIPGPKPVFWYDTGIHARVNPRQSRGLPDRLANTHNEFTASNLHRL